MDNDLDSEALRILRRAESKAETIDEHASCAATWFNILGNKLSAQRCLKKAAKLVAAVDDWVMIAAYWADFDMKERAVHAVTSAKMDASTSQDFITCADAFLSSCQDRQAAADCLSVAQQRTSHPHELASIASLWARAENVGEAKKAVQAAEERIQKQDDVDVWLSIAEAWSAIGEFPRVKLALDNARHRATTAEDRETVAFMESELITALTASTRNSIGNPLSLLMMHRLMVSIARSATPVLASDFSDRMMTSWLGLMQL